MKLSPLQLSFYQVMELSVAYRSEHDPDKPEPDTICHGMEAYLHVDRDQSHESYENTCWHVALRLSFQPLDDDNSRYSFVAGLLGVFFCANETPKGLDAETLVGVNGTSILYGIARDLILTISEKGPWGALTLPTMSFTDFRTMLENDEHSEPPPEPPSDP